MPHFYICFWDTSNAWNGPDLTQKCLNNARNNKEQEEHTYGPEGGHNEPSMKASSAVPGKPSCLLEEEQFIKIKEEKKKKASIV